MAKGTSKVEEKQEQSGKVRTSIWINPDLLKKIQYIAFMDEAYASQTEFITEIFNEAVAKWEKKNGEAVKK